MTKKLHSVVEDRALRDAALALFKADLSQIKADLSGKGLGERVADRLGEGTRDLAEEVIDLAEKNPGKVAALVAGAVLWFFRSPLLDWTSNHLDGFEAESSEQDEADLGSY